MAKGAKIVRPIHAREGEFVDIHWRLRTGTTLIERRTCAPPATTDIRTQIPQCEAVHPRLGRCALHEVHVGAHTTHGGHSFTTPPPATT